eukprot:11065386-Alexandrium_andersonii.AAC.1
MTARIGSTTTTSMTAVATGTVARIATTTIATASDDAGHECKYYADCHNGDVYDWSDYECDQSDCRND